MTTLALVDKIPHWELIQRCQNRDEDAFRQFFELFQTRVRKIAVKILKDDAAAEDATQETFLNVFRAIGRFRGDSQITTWLSRIAINVCFEMLRRNGRINSHKVTDVDGKIQENLPAKDTPYTTFCEQERDEILAAVLTTLGPKHRAVVDLHDFEGYTIKEISERLRVTEGTVKSRLFYGRIAFKKSYIHCLRKGLHNGFRRKFAPAA